jgi:hypothetical protein
MSPNALRFGLAIATLVGAGRLREHNDDVLFTDRSFFGVYKVVRDHNATLLYHGNIVHGGQLDSLPLEPTTYYHPAGPLGQVFDSIPPASKTRNVAVVGLGTGSILCYSKPGDRWTFFEIDPLVEAIASNARLFTFLSNCAVKPRIVIGDARLKMSRESGHQYSIIVLDAFSSDAIPVHLLTREAFAVYERLLAEHGLLLVHISNGRLDLEPVVDALAKNAGMVALVRDFDPLEPLSYRRLKYASHWVILARTRTDLISLADDRRWRNLRSGRHLWTDDYSNLVSIIKW